MSWLYNLRLPTGEDVVAEVLQHNQGIRESCVHKLGQTPQSKF